MDSFDTLRIFGVSNASRDQATIWDKLNSYNAKNPNEGVSLDHVAHSLGASSTKNAMNWAGYKDIDLNETTLDHTQQSAARSQVGSLSGDTIIRTDGHYQQTGSVVTSQDGDVDITAKSANITATRSDYESNYKRTMEQKGVTVAVNIPVVQAIQAVEKTVNSAKSVGSSKNDRINALGAVNAGFEAWRTAEQVGKLVDAMGQNPAQALSQDVSVSITYGEQKSVETQHSEGNKAEKSQINAGGKVNINTKGDGKNSTLTIAGSDVSGKGGTHLKAEGDVNILAVDENHLERSQNKSSGFNAGIALQLDNTGSAALGVTAGGNVAKGYGNGESRAWVGSQVGSQTSQTEIESGGDTNIVGSQVKGKSVKVNAENLNIQSLQDTMKYVGKQESANGQVTVGYGVSGSASYSKSKMNADYASVNQQAGIFAGDEGYDIDIANHSDLKAGLVTSTDKAEAEGKNRFSTGTLNATNLDNHANYKGSSMGVSASAAANFDTPLGDKGQAQSSKTVKDESGNQVLAKGVASLQTGLNVGYGSDKGSQSSQTTSGINTQNLIIRDEQAQLDKTGKTTAQIKEEVKTDITTDSAESHSGKLENRFDKDKLQKELDYQVKALSDFQTITLATINEKVATHAESKRVEAEQAKAAGNLAKAKILENEAEKWETGGAYRQGVDAITNAVGLALGGSPTAGVITGAVSPYINTEIKQATEGNTEANLIAHALWGAVEAYAQGGKAGAGAVAAVTGEVGAKLISEQVFDKSPENLTEAEKQTVSELSQVAAGLAGGLSTSGGNSLSTAQAMKTGQEVGKNAVENNSLVVDRLRENKKADAEKWKLKVREKIGHNTASQFINGVIDVVEEGADSALFVGDTVFDTFALLTTCAVGDSYCNQAKIDLAGKNQAVSNTLNALMTGEYWEGVKAVAKQAYEGDQQALENFSGILTGLLLPTKVLPNNSKLGDFSRKAPNSINASSDLSVVGETLGYKTIHVDFNKSLIKGSDESHLVNNLAANT
ncbi:hemagglutinin repeat-containing protein, partial [Mannheimia sp. E30BD]|uniref:hemagglutinin repeat-containing protein n=1 Tax=Mannheimia sp. E30BD TaxID=3278708 RepID=UPI00359CD64E